MIRLALLVFLAPLAACITGPTDVHVAWKTDRESTTVPAEDVGAVIYYDDQSGGDMTWVRGYTNATVVQAVSGHVCIELAQRIETYEEQFGQDKLVYDYDPMSAEVCDDIDMSAETPAHTFDLVLR